MDERGGCTADGVSLSSFPTISQTEYQRGLGANAGPERTPRRSAVGSRLRNRSIAPKRTVAPDGEITCGRRIESRVSALSFPTARYPRGAGLTRPGKWTAEEEDTLLQAVREANLALGKDEFARDAPWEVVVHKMGGKRTAPQCRKKWYVSSSLPHRASRLHFALAHRSDQARQAPSDTPRRRIVSREQSVQEEAPGKDGGGGCGECSSNRRIGIGCQARPEEVRKGHDGASVSHRLLFSPHRALCWVWCESRLKSFRRLNDLQPRPTTISGIDWASLAASTLPTHPPETLAKAFKKCIKEADATTTMSLDGESTYPHVFTCLACPR